jgi:hypothetical protein
MTLKSRIENQLKLVRGMSEKMLGAFDTPDQWTFQVHEQANHALWFAGHIGTVDNFMIARLTPAKGQEKAGYKEKFGMGSRPLASPAEYPPVKEVLAFWRERREALLGILGGLTDEELAKPCPPGAPEFMTDVGSMFEAAVWHEAMHLGQVTIARRALGRPPLAGS